MSDPWMPRLKLQQLKGSPANMLLSHSKESSRALEESRPPQVRAVFFQPKPEHYEAGFYNNNVSMPIDHLCVLLR